MGHGHKHRCCPSLGQRPLLHPYAPYTIGTTLHTAASDVRTSTTCARDRTSICNGTDRKYTSLFKSAYPPFEPKPCSHTHTYEVYARPCHQRTRSIMQRNVRELACSSTIEWHSSAPRCASQASQGFVTGRSMHMSAKGRAEVAWPSTHPPTKSSEQPPGDMKLKCSSNNNMEGHSSVHRRAYAAQGWGGERRRCMHTGTEGRTILAWPSTHLPSKSSEQPLDDISNNNMEGHSVHRRAYATQGWGGQRRCMHTSAEGRTIFALSSAPGKAGVAVIRISGPRASQVCRKYD